MLSKSDVWHRSCYLNERIEWPEIGDWAMLLEIKWSATTMHSQYEVRMRQPRIAMIADRLIALLPEDGLTISHHDAKARLMYDDWTITDREFEGAVALAAARRQITRTFGGAIIARFEVNNMPRHLFGEARLR
jgi:hypothetical protein